MPANVPTKDEFDALAARVTALEKSPPVGGPTPDGIYISTPGAAPLVDDVGNAYALVLATAPATGYQITKNKVLDPVTNAVAIIGMSGRKCVQKNSAGNWYQDNNNTTKTNTASWQQISDPNAPPVQPGSLFHVSGGNIHKPDGTVWKPTGVDIWWASLSTTAPPTGWNQLNQVIADWNTGAPLLQAFPDVNAIRLACFMDDFPTPQQLKPLVDFCTAKHIVLIIDAHDYSGGSNWVYSYGDGSLQRAVQFFDTHAKAWKDNPWVMFQTENEPGTPNTDEMNALYDAVRNTGNNTPIFLSWVTWGFTDRVDHNIAKRMNNVLIDLHYYASGAGSGNMDINAHIKWIADTTNAINNTFKSGDGEIPICCLEFGDACCGAVEQAGLIACEAVVKSAFKGWTIWNWTTDWNHSWGVDVINDGGNAVKGGAVVKPYMKRN